ncbi:ferrochelatase [Georgenia satyanarayanai]|uniref:ferrochelatase n=1 Tax=Georgenia satyanarayanai TaxID=860221 RepID=UPI00203C1C5F|nr:ferrochelatase [Georgenia satyanarayanai]MCM3662078.1 ferrochelatase [Georgenia satyanarayanai]
MSHPAAPYDALLLCSFGGPNKTEDVVPFLRNVVRGKGIPDERLAEVGEHYFAFDGKSPINEQNLALRAALAAELRERGVDLPVLWGNRNWHPYTVDTLRDAVAFGARRILVLVTSAYASYSGSRQYREHLAAAVSELGIDAEGLEIDVLRPFFNDAGFVDANTDAVLAAVEQLPAGDGVHVAYVTHSIPDTMQDASAATGPGYREQHEDVRAAIDATLRERGLTVTSSLSYCSRSGDPRTPWLEPDVNDHLAQLAEDGVTRLVIAPIGFISDHMEVAWDLDTEAMETARELGMAAARAATAGTAPVFVSGLVDLVLERAAREGGEEPQVTVRGQLPAFPDVAPPGSCRMRHGEVTGVPVLAGPAD